MASRTLGIKINQQNLEMLWYTWHTVHRIGFWCFMDIFGLFFTKKKYLQDLGFLFKHEMYKTLQQGECISFLKSNDKTYMKLFGQLKHLIKKIIHDVCFRTQCSQFSQKTMQFRLLVVIFSQSALNYCQFHVSIISDFVFFFISTYLFLLNDFFDDEN